MPEPRPADHVPARNDAQARGRYLDFLQRSLSAVHPTAIWRAQGVLGKPDENVALTVPETVTLEDGDGRRVYLRATQGFTYGDNERVAKERKVNTLQYAYTLSDDPNLAAELFSWQWHPPVWPEPHMHIGRGHPDHGVLSKLHVPTGRVAFEQVLRFAITEYDVVTARPREEALAILDDVLARFHRHKSW